jgi:hypothetical protein
MSASPKRKLGIESIETFDENLFTKEMDIAPYSSITKIPFWSMVEGKNKVYLMNENSRK